MAHNFTDLQPEYITAFDTETTGLPDWKNPSDSPNQPHIVQIAAKVIHVPTRRVQHAIDLLVAHDGWQSDPKSLETHGITAERANAVGVPEQTALAVFLNLYQRAPFRLCYSHTFDARLIRIATKRFSNETTQEIWKAQNDQYHDPMLVAKQIMRLPPKGRYGWKNPTLAAAYAHFCGGKEIANAHSASGDLDATIELYWALIDYIAANPGCMED